MYDVLGLAIEGARWVALGAAGIYFVVRWRDRRAGDEPNCRNCQYALIGLPDSVERCPECGADLRARGAVAHGYNRSLNKPFFLLIAAGLFCFASGYAIDQLNKQHQLILLRPTHLAAAAGNDDVAGVNALLTRDPALLNKADLQARLAREIVGRDAANVLQSLLPRLPVDNVKTPPFNQWSGRNRPAWVPMLHAAALAGSGKVMATLLANGVSPDLPDANGATPLHYAATGLAPSLTVPLLLSNGASIDAKDNAGTTALVAALAERNRLAATLLLAAKPSLAGSLADGRTALHLAMELTDSQLVTQLVAGGADLAAKDVAGRTPLAWIAQRNSDRYFAPGIAYSLVEAELRNRGKAGVVRLITADPTFLTVSGDNGGVLHQTKLVDILSAFLEAGADPNLRDDKGRTPLFQWAMEKSPVGAELLLAHKADVNAPAHDGSQPLSAALRFYSDTKTAEFLLSRGASVTHQDRYGATAMHYAILNSHQPDMAKLVLSHGAVMTLSAAVALSRNDDARRMIASDPGTVTSAANAERYTPLHFAAKVNNTHAIGLLLDNGAVIDAVGAAPADNTPMLMALSHNKVEAIKELIKRGAKVTWVPGSRISPFHAAIEWNRGPEVVKLMIDRGADIQAPDREGETPLHLAVAAGDAEVVKLLLLAGARVDVADGKGRLPVAMLRNVQGNGAKVIAGLLAGASPNP